MTEPDENVDHRMAHHRQAAVDTLMDHFANDEMDVDEFERRVGRAHAATSVDELRALLQDLPRGGDLPALRDTASTLDPSRAARHTVTARSHTKDREFVVACLGGTSRRGRWTPARRNYAVALLGGAELDFREAVFAAGVTEVQVLAICGGVEVIVPPGLNVESHGVALLGGFDHSADSDASTDSRAPTLRITGLAAMAGVDVSVRYPGESARDARRRRRAERRAQRRRIREE